MALGAVRQAVGGGCQSGCGRILSVTHGSWHLQSGGQWLGPGGGGGGTPPFQGGPAHRLRWPGQRPQEDRRRATAPPLHPSGHRCHMPRSATPAPSAARLLRHVQ